MSTETKTPAPASRPERRARSLAELSAEQGLTGPQNLDALIGASADLWNNDADFESFLENLREPRPTGE